MADVSESLRLFWILCSRYQIDKSKATLGKLKLLATRDDHAGRAARRMVDAIVQRQELEYHDNEG